MYLLSCAQQFEPKWIGNVVLLNVEGDTIATPLEKANVQIKTTASAGRIITGIGNIRQKAVIKGAHSTVQTNSNKPIILIIRCKDNESDPTSFIQVIKFEETSKERKTEFSKVNWLDNVSEGNMKLLSYDADIYGKSSYILTISPILGEFGVRIVNPNDVDEKVLIFNCFGTYGSSFQNNEKFPVDSYELNGVNYPVYKSNDGRLFIMKSKSEKIYLQ